MVRLINSMGVEANVDDATAALLGPDWTPAVHDESAEEPADGSEPEGTDEAAEEPAGQGAVPDPPKGNASRADWAAYAASIGIAYTDDDNRDDIRDLVTARKEA